MSYSAPKSMTIGHVHLKVSNLERSIAFYRDVIGLELQERFGDQAAFLSAGGYHHHIGLNTWSSLDGPPASRRSPGLYHVAFLYPDRADLALAYANVINSGVRIEGAADHGVSEAIYFSDPDGNGIEIYWDRPMKDWPRREDGSIAMTNARLDLDALLGQVPHPA